MAEYQLPSDGFDGRAYSGVIKSDGTWVPCEADNEDWQEYEKWVNDPKADPPNKPDPYRSPADGGVAIKLKEGEEAVGCMVDSLPPEPATKPPEQMGPPAPPPAQHVPPPPHAPPPSRDKK